MKPEARRWGNPVVVLPPRLPLLLWVVLGATLLACVVGDLQVFYFSVKGWMWVVPTALAMAELFNQRTSRPFPLALWLPWSILCLTYLIVSPFQNALQRTVIILAPIVVGYACSGLPLNERSAQEILLRCKQFALLLFLVMLGEIGFLASGILPDITGLAPQSITASLLAVYFAAAFAYESPGALPAWAIMAALPLVAVTRTAILVTGMTLAATFAPLPAVRRLVILVLLLVTAVAVFQTERFQKKMFYSGSGTLADLDMDNPDFRSTGRFNLWSLMKVEIERKPIFGHGANAQEDFILSQIHFRGQPHNDWLRLRFDYGWVGTGLYALTLLVQALLLLRLAYGPEAPSVEARILLTGGAGTFVVYAAMMLTDNILLYSSFFGVMQFALIGVAYAVVAAERGQRAAAGGEPQQS